MIFQLLFRIFFLVNLIQTISNVKENRIFQDFKLNDENVESSECEKIKSVEILKHFAFKTCPIRFDPICNDPIFDIFEDFYFRCSFPMHSNKVLQINSSSFTDLMKFRDPYRRDWCMIVMFYSPSCPFSARLAPFFNEIAGKFKNILTVAVDASDFTNSHRMNFRYGVSGTPTVILWVNGIGVARMKNQVLNLENLKVLIRNHTDLQEISEKFEKIEENHIPNEFFEAGAEIKELVVNSEDVQFISGFYAFGCFLVCLICFIYHVRERILLSAPVLQWFQSKCGGPLCDDIYFLFYVAAPRNRIPQAPPPQNDDVIELPPLVVEADNN